MRSRCSRVGTKSFELEHQIWTDDRLVADAKSVLVGYDYTHGTSVPLTETRGGDSLHERLSSAKHCRTDCGC